MAVTFTRSEPPAATVPAMTSSPTCLEIGAGLARDHRLVHVGRPLDDQAIGRDPRSWTDEHDIVHLQRADRHLLGAIGNHPLGRVRQQSREGRERALCLRDRPHLEPVPEQHDRDQRGQFPPDLDLEEAERAGPRGHEGDDDRQRDEGHHPRLAVGQLALGSSDEDHPAVEEDDRPEDRRHVLDARDRRDRVADPARDLRAQQHGRDGQGKAEPELVAEHRHRVAGVPVMPSRVPLVMGVGRGRWFVVLLVGCVIHPGPSLRYSPPVSTNRQDRRVFGRRMLRVPGLRSDGVGLG